MSGLTRRQVFQWGALAATGFTLKAAGAEQQNGHQFDGHGSVMRPYSLLPAGSVKPRGWIFAQMSGDLQHGITGAYDQIEPNVAQNVFVKHDISIVGSDGNHDDLHTETGWWQGEQEGYWKDAVIRSAFLTDNAEWISRSKKWIEEIVASQGSDGYIGIYSRQSRFQQVAGAEAELWTQSRIFQAMLAYYEFTGNEQVLSAVERAVQLTLRMYEQTYFGKPGKATTGGMKHGIGFGDTLEYLYRITAKTCYSDGIQWLYRDFCDAFPSDDMAIASLMNPRVNWETHAPHLAESLPLPFYCHTLTDNTLMGTAARNVIEKWRRCLTPGGGIVGDAEEAVARLYGTAKTYCEYCGMTEELIAANRIMSWSGDLSIGDIAERVSLNAAQGARTHPTNIAVAYLSRDNQMTTDQKRTIGDRILFSARHRAAACCALNSMRLMPYYVEAMWLKVSKEPGLLANLYGSCVLNTQIGDAQISVAEETTYPFSDSLLFRIDPDREVEFCLQLRVPENARSTEIIASEDARIEKRVGMILIRKKWRRGDEVQLTFRFDVRCATAHDNEYYYVRGPLVYGIEFPQKMIALRSILDNGKDSGFSEYLSVPQSTDGWDYRIGSRKEPNYGFTLSSRRVEGEEMPWADPPIQLAGKMKAEDGHAIDVTLVPMGCANLRRVTFPKEGENDIEFVDDKPWADDQLAQEAAFERPPALCQRT